ncbi:MAG: hypothetical protein MRECE_40c006 [Mycoplasmataceae bacterium CE_OT135]|nr:MAG: hypothetical protein MRECE_40c006 [Mycoplasmataceae bacterium CE_OT135]
MVNDQEYLNQNYPQDQRNTIKKLDIGEKNLTGSLDLRDFVNLEILYCYDNQLTTLNLTNCRQLKRISCSSNNLSDLKLPYSATEQLTSLNINNNNFSGDLSLFSHLVNLEWLWIGNNRFIGSLQPLQNLTKLKILDIRNTDIDSGLDYLPDSLEDFHCSADKGIDAKCKAIYNLFANDQGEVETDKYGNIENFPQKLQVYRQWRKFNFPEEEIKQWITAGATLNDYNLHQKWEEQKFTLQQINQWINSGAKAHDYEFVKWLKDIKKETPEWITNYKEDYQALSERFKKYGLCPECNQPNTGDQWCQSCNVSRLQENFSQWTSGNPKIDAFIKEYQLAATDADKFLEWIPYGQFTDISKKPIGEGGFGKVYKAKWIAGSIEKWDAEKNQWQRDKDYYYDENDKRKRNKKYRNHKVVVLKTLNRSQNINDDFLKETAKHKDIDDWFNNIVSCYGLSQNPKTKEYLMVIKYLAKGNLRQYLDNNRLSFQTKLERLAKIAQGLKDIHNKGLIHRDFHSGNILNSTMHSFITDLGLCKPANETKQEKIYGVLPYVAPEVLNSEPYTKASDIYSFGIVVYEILSGLPPYYEKAHDLHLAIEICQGLRPKFQIKIPPLLEDLIKKCWDADPQKRPTANELERTLRKWQEEIKESSSSSYQYYREDKKEDTEFKNQLQVAEEFNKTLPDEVKYPKYKIHKGASYHSKLLPTKEITKILKTLQLNDSKQLNLEIPFELEQLSISEEKQQPEQQAQILQPTNQPYGTPSSSKNN